MLQKAPKLRVIGRAGVGVDNVDLDAATLAEDKLTRAYLEQYCRQLRGVLGLEVPRPDTEPEDS